MAATTRHFKKAYRPTAQDLGLIPFNEAMDMVKGTTATLLTRPTDATILVLKAEVDNWLMKPSDYTAGLTDTSATTTGSTAGNAPWSMDAGTERVIAAPATITVKGPNAGSILRYYWI